MAERSMKWLADMFGGGIDESESEESVGPIYPTPDGKSISSSAADGSTLQPVKNWSYPFKQKNKASVIDQLTQLANATAGYYPLGAGGLWHGGVHFDSGTAGVLDQSSVVCIADGEVVAYRTDMNSVVTSYVENKKPAPKPFSRNFVLVRHRLEAPKLQGSNDTPPSLIIYSLYMHLQDGAVYQSTPTIARPQFWEKKDDYIVPMTAKDADPNLSARLGLNVRNQEKRGIVIDLLPQGSRVRVSGEGAYRRLQDTMGPARLLDAGGSMLGYVRFDQLEPVEGGEYRTKAGLTIHDEINSKPSLRKPGLPKGTQVKISGEGEFRKLERVVQFVHFDSLQALPVPRAHGVICVLDKPLPIKAGALIGHIGQYQDYSAIQPERKLHLEVFSDRDVGRFIAQCRIWEKGLPAKDKTLLKLAKGTVVVVHKHHFGEMLPPTQNDESQLNGADLFVPRSLLDGLPSTHKIAISEAGEHEACNWYRLEGLLSNEKNQLLDGWVRVEKGGEQWTSPWAWEGYEVITDYTSPPEFMAASLRSLKRLTDEQIRRYGPVADAGDKGPIKERLFNFIDGDGDGDKKITAEELRAVIRIPAHAQALSRLIIYCESEWNYRPQKWDILDEILGHTGSTPHINWLAEKQRIEQLSWWGDVAEKAGLPSNGQVYHLHSVGLVGLFETQSSCITLDEAIELALLVSGGYEGRRLLDYHALADDFDGQGTSFGLIQWNFGQGTLGALLLKMLRRNAPVFSGCFPLNMDYASLEAALVNKNTAAQLSWARGVLRTNRVGWRQAFQAIGDVEEFQKIQLSEAAAYHSNVVKCIRHMRGVAPSAMERVGVVTYVALYDLCVQQGGFEKGATIRNIQEEVISAKSIDQGALLEICVRERAKTASSRWMADSLSRRMGIIEGEPYLAVLGGRSVRRENPNVHLLSKVRDFHVCDI